MARWRERRSCCRPTAAPLHPPSNSRRLFSLRRLSRLLAAPCSQGSQPPSLGRVLPGCPKPRPPSSPWKNPCTNGGLGLCRSLTDSPHFPPSLQGRQTPTHRLPRHRHRQTPRETAAATATKTHTHTHTQTRPGETQHVFPCPSGPAPGC